MPGAGRWGKRESLVKGYKLSVARGTRIDDLMYNKMSIVDNTEIIEIC